VSEMKILIFVCRRTIAVKFETKIILKRKKFPGLPEFDKALDRVQCGGYCTRERLLCGFR